jgi:8-oxo-(d)GTP phosphatase
MRIIVVRHGQAEPKKRWAGPDAERPLTARGRAQADRLGKVIGPKRPCKIISSPAVRCVQTVKRYADERGLSVELSPSLSPDAGPDALALCRYLASSAPADSTVVLCTHREVLVGLLPRLSRDLNRRLAHRPPGAKGGAWVLRFRAGKLAKADYRPPAV